jgi:pentatricopeptide repeat domain-containing protein 1
MKQNELSQQRSTYRACLQECFELGNFESASSILSAMKTAQVEPDAMDISLVVSTMCRNSNWKCGMDLLLREDTPRVVPVEAYDAVLSCMPSRKWKDSLQMLHVMETFPEIHPTPILSTYRAVIETCVSAQQAEQAFQILISMPRKGFKVRILLLCIVYLQLNACFPCQLTPRFIRVTRFQPTVYKFELVISALTKTMQWRRALQLFDTMDELNIPKTVVTYNTVISACARAGEVGTAKNLLQRMKRSGISPNIISFNAVMTACASTSRWKDALHILDQCHYEPGVQPDIITYTNAMRACSRGGKTNKALTLLQVVKDKKLPIDNYCYAAVIDGAYKGM